MGDLFLELFPLETDRIPALVAYRPRYTGKGSAKQIKGLIARLRKAFPGNWLWVEGLIITDVSLSPIQLDIHTDLMREQAPDIYGSLEALEEQDGWKPSAMVQLNWVLQIQAGDLEEALRELLNKEAIKGQIATIERDYLLQPFIVDNIAALAISVISYARSNLSVQGWIDAGEKPDSMVGLPIRYQGYQARITEIIGKLGKRRRERMLAENSSPALQSILSNAPDDERIVRIQLDEDFLEVPASTLSIELQAAEMLRFGINPAQIAPFLQLNAEKRAKTIRTLADRLRERGIIKRAFNERTHPQYFTTLDFVPNLVYEGRKVMPYQPRTLANDFYRGRSYRQHPRFAHEAIRIAAINFLSDNIVDDFLEAMRRELERHYGFTIELIRERKIRVISAKNIEAAVRTVEKEAPHIILAFLPDLAEMHQEDEPYYAALKLLTLGKGIASHPVYESAIHDPDAMALLIMALLAKTGSTPFVLAEPLEYADYVVGLDMLREQLSKGDRLTGINRIYKRDGEFLRYIIDTIELDTDDPVPFVIMQKLFPMDLFEGKRVIVHHDGAYSAELLHLLRRWGDVLRTSFYPVEVLRGPVPAMYNFDGGQIKAADWGSLFLVNAEESLVVSGANLAPLYVRSQAHTLAVEYAVYSVLAWTLLHYSSAQPARLPVTLQYASDMQTWLTRGMLPQQLEGDIPFWL